MKNKKSIYILLPLVLLIWGAILYQVFNYSNTESSTDIIEKPPVKPLVLKPKDSVTITINARDPFSGKLVDDAKKQTNIKLHKSTTNHKEKQQVLWPPIAYKGIVSDTKDKLKVYMVIITGRTYMMKKGDIQDDVVLEQGDRNNILLKYKGETKEVGIQ